MLSLYAKWKGFAYLRSTLHSILDRLVLTSQELDLELDPARVSTAEELEKNAVQLQIVAKVFMDDICASAPNIPSSFRKICNIVSIYTITRLLLTLLNGHRFITLYFLAFQTLNIRPSGLLCFCASFAQQLLLLKLKASLTHHHQKK